MSVKLLDRGKALETEFFNQQDQAAIAALRSSLEKQEATAPPAAAATSS